MVWGLRLRIEGLAVPAPVAICLGFVWVEGSVGFGDEEFQCFRLGATGVKFSFSSSWILLLDDLVAFSGRAKERP